MSIQPRIGFIGQGWIGSNYARDFEARGYTVVRYAKEEPYTNNCDVIKDCDIVFIAVPTPTSSKGFDDSIVRSVVKFVGKGKIAVIKSTILPGTTESIQKENKDVLLMHSPEFLTEATAAHDAAHPLRNIIGIPEDTAEYRAAAEKVLSVLPKAPYECICPVRDAEFIKYAGNTLFYVKVVYINMLYDLSQKLGCSWSTVRDAMIADPRIGPSHLDPVHKSGRGAGGDCFIKDFEAFRGFYRKELKDDAKGNDIFSLLVEKNNSLLVTSNKDIELLKSVYGDIL